MSEEQPKIPKIKERIYEMEGAMPFSIHFYSDTKFRIPKVQAMGQLPSHKVSYEKDALSDFVALEISRSLIQAVLDADTKQKGENKFTRKERKAFSDGMHALNTIQGYILEPAFKTVVIAYKEQNPSE